MNPVSSISSSAIQAYQKLAQQPRTAPTRKLEVQETGQSEQQELLTGAQEINESQVGRNLNILA
jgi:hypothetical protein